MVEATHYAAIGDGADRAALAAARKSAVRRRSAWPRRRLSARVAALMWILRFYVIGMLAVVAVQIARLV